MSPKPYQRTSNSPADKPTWLGAVLEFLQADNWPHETVEDGSAVLTGYQGERGVYDVTIEVNEADCLVVIYAQLPVDLGEEAPPEAVSNVAELVLRINSNLAVGNLDLDLDEGQVRFRVGYRLEHVPPVAALVQNALYTAVHAAEQFSPLVQTVAAGEIDVEAAIAQLAGN